MSENDVREIYRRFGTTFESLARIEGRLESLATREFVGSAITHRYEACQAGQQRALSIAATDEDTTINWRRAAKVWGPIIAAAGAIIGTAIGLR